LSLSGKRPDPINTRNEEYAKYYTGEVMGIVLREFQSPDEEMKKVVLKVVSRCAGTQAGTPQIPADQANPATPLKPSTPAVFIASPTSEKIPNPVTSRHLFLEPWGRYGQKRKYWLIEGQGTFFLNFPRGQIF
jgi:hypothetical protein